MKKASNILHRQNMRKIHDIYIVAKSKIFTIFEIRSEVGPKFNITHIYAFLFRSFFHINFRKFYEEIIIWTCKLYLKKFQMKSLFLLLFDLESLGFLSKQYIYFSFICRIGGVHHRCDKETSDCKRKCQLPNAKARMKKIMFILKWRTAIL